MSSRIKFEKIIKQRKIYMERYDVFEVRLWLNDQQFDPNYATENKKAIQNAIQEKYWNALKRLCLPGHIMVVKLSGIHFHIEDIQKYMHLKVKHQKLDMILHYLSWKGKKGVHLSDNFAIIESNRQLFRQLFDKFWFALGFELHFEGIILRPDKMYDIEKWSRRIESRRTYDDLIHMSSLVLDNQHNGFHFKVISNPEYSKLVESCLSKLQRAKGRSSKC